MKGLFFTLLGGMFAFSMIVFISCEKEKNIKERVITVTSIDLYPTSQLSSLIVGGPAGKIGVALTPTDATDLNVIWSVSPRGVVEVSPDGKVTALAPGSALITATAVGGSDISGTCTVTVIEMFLGESVEINGVTWATRNVSYAPGKSFIAFPWDDGGNYTFKTAQGVCPEGWRVPTWKEFESLIASGGSWTSANGILGYRFGSGNQTVFFPAGGMLPESGSGGMVQHRGQRGYYWASTRVDTYKSNFLHFDQYRISERNENRNTDSFNVRCVEGYPEPEPDPGPMGDEVVIDGITWATRNVGAPGTFVANPWDYGGHYIFERAQKVCPDGWRTPTLNEFESLAASGSEWVIIKDELGRRFGRDGNTIFLPASGFRSYYTWNWDYLGSSGRYWAADQEANSNSKGVAMTFSKAHVTMIVGEENGYGFSVRCVAE